ncbi:MAG: hypothetical protein HFF02_06770 [Erysipelotrichaceae bacterium]|nr:hypothetical protein [Erysipelotrichaceae bacterium]
MNVLLNDNEIKLLNDKGIDITPNKDYSESEMFELLDKARDVEVFYSQGSSDYDLVMANQYADIADKIQASIPNV